MSVVITCLLDDPMCKISRTTIKDVAQKAGVSVQTVSRVINGRPDVAPETRERVTAVIHNLGFRPSALARGLIRGRSSTLGILIAKSKYASSLPILDGVISEAGKHGYTLLLEKLPSDTETEIAPLLDLLLSHHVDGILWAIPEIGGNHAWLDMQRDEMPVPIVFLNMRPRQGTASVAIDNYTGATLATKHLLDMDRREIAHISGPLEWWEARERMRGWQDAMKATGRDPVFSVEGNWSASSGEDAANQLLNAHPETDAIFVANDQMALGVLLVAHQRKIRIPEDLAVVGFDDLAESAYCFPPLTTVPQDHFALGAHCVRMLVEQIEAERKGMAISPHAVVISPVLVIRSSTCL
jgi:LacI family transcriptional regulator